MGNDMAPYFITIRRFYVNESSFEWVELHSKYECWLTEQSSLYLFLNCLVNSFIAF
jgi:hypothetical protein